MQTIASRWTIYLQEACTIELHRPLQLATRILSVLSADCCGCRSCTYILSSVLSPPSSVNMCIVYTRWQWQLNEHSVAFSSERGDNRANEEECKAQGRVCYRRRSPLGRRTQAGIMRSPSLREAERAQHRESDRQAAAGCRIRIDAR